MTRCLRLVLCLWTVLVTAPALAAPDAPVVVSTPTVGDSFSPGFRDIADFPLPYVEEEFFIEGTADVFAYDNDPPTRGEKSVVSTLPYKTRFLVRRPQNAHDFNGTVVIEWFNTTAGFDTAPVYDASAGHFGREGMIYIGFTNSQQGLGFLLFGCPALVTFEPQCLGRYADLLIAEDGQAYEIASQLANLLKNGANNPLPAGFHVQRIFHAGQSQQGGSVTTYASEFHFPVNDGYFIQSAGGGSRSLSTDSPRFATGDPQGFAPRDLPVPVVRAVGENDVVRSILTRGTRQEDAPNFRYYEIAGGAHNAVHKDIEVIPAGVLTPFPIFLEDVCALPSNTTGDGPVFSGMVYSATFRNMERRVRRGRPLPRGAVLETDENGVVRDEFGNARGGIRLPQLDVPVATYGPFNVPNPALPLPPDLAGLGQLICALNGSVTDFDTATIDTLYPTPRSFRVPFFWRTLSLVWKRLLTVEDAIQLLREAYASEAGS
ncbi:MAG: alpha/beta hydrolase domain-containing protein [Myxococcota bacterium]